MPAALTLRPAVFSILRMLIEERAGLHYSIEDQDMIADKLSTRALDAGFESLLDYYYYLRYDPSSQGEFDALIDALVVNETYFFREFEPLQHIVDHHLAPRIAAGLRPRVWCAACSTGEEPLSLALLLNERGLLDRVSIVATDISQRALRRAQAGEHGLRSLRRPPPRDFTAHGLDTSSGVARVDAPLRQAIDWRRVNLLDGAQIESLGTFDLILCRNVLIYFSDATIQRVLGHLTRALDDHGALFVGISESLLRFGTALSCEERGGVFFYRKASS